jgi:periplasmic copper chaperone A
MKTIRFILLFLLLTPVLTQAAGIEVTNAWMNESIPGSENGAGYFTLTNTDTAAVKLIGAKTNASRATEVHQHVLRDGMMRMKRVSELVIEPQQTIVFQPGGYHLMMFGVKKAYSPGEAVEFELYFDDGEALQVIATVKPIR